jgi:hypothetical protein
MNGINLEHKQIAACFQIPSHQKKIKLLAAAAVALGTSFVMQSRVKALCYNSIYIHYLVKNERHAAEGMSAHKKSESPSKFNNSTCSARSFSSENLNLPQRLLSHTRLCGKSLLDWVK